MPTHTTRDFRSVEPFPSYEPTIGRWLWMLEDTRRETKMALANIDQSLLDWTPSPTENNIGTLLYHIGLIELDWLYVEVLENAPWPEE
ncbi:MAG TPA: DinB family protein, partial [Ktedonobacteraceae bacterium]|nr:DinB family protein [Ktedonobacteraceae bacterium]